MLEMEIILQFIDLFLEKETCIRNISKFDNTFKIIMFNTYSNSMYYFSYLFTVLWGIVFILTIIYMINRLIWNPYEELENSHRREQRIVPVPIKSKTNKLRVRVFIKFYPQKLPERARDLIFLSEKIQIE